MTHDATRRRQTPPRYLRHRSRDRGYSNYRDSEGNRRQRMFPGRHGSLESLAAYREFLSDWETENLSPRPRGWAGRRMPDAAAPTVAVLADRFLAWAEREFVRDGVATGEANNYRDALRYPVRLFGSLEAERFGPRELRCARDAMIAETWTASQRPSAAGQPRLSRKTINQRVRRIRRVWKWALAEGLVERAIHLELAAVDPLKRGRGVRESKPVTAVRDADVEAILPFVTPTVRAMIEFAWHTGARPGEVCALRWANVDRSRPVWLFTPVEHKTMHLEHGRVVAIGARAQAALAAFLNLEEGEPVFSPSRAQRERRARARARRRTRVQPSQRLRSQRAKDRPAEKYRDTYDANSFRRAIHRGVDAANAARLRAAIANAVATEFELEPSQVAGELETLSTCRMIANDGKASLDDQYLAPRLETAVGAAGAAAALAVARAAASAAELIQRWAPNQLRHAFEHRAEDQFGPTKASRALGHASASTVSHYMRKSGIADAIEVASAIG